MMNGLTNQTYTVIV